MLNRRKLITGLISFAAAPAIVRASSLMPVKVMDSFDPQEVFNEYLNVQIKLFDNLIVGDMVTFSNILGTFEIKAVLPDDYYVMS